jgi:sec-independent protein translocase protein TatA
MFRNLGDNPWILLVLVLIIVLVFGANRLPGAARSLGRSMRIFKSEVKEMKDDRDPPSSPGTTPEGGAPLHGRVVEPGENPVRSPEQATGDARRDA